MRTELRQWQMSHYSDLTMQDKEYLPKQQMFLTPGGAGVTDMREQYEDALRVLLIAAACVLLIACANLANLLLARGLRNRQQTSLRIALGASRGRLVRKALVESLLLGLVGGAAGLAVAYLGTLADASPRLHGSQLLGSDRRLSFGAGASVCARRFLVDRRPLRHRSGVDDVSCRAGGSFARRESLHGARRALAAEGAGDRAGRGVAGADQCGGDAVAEPAQPASIRTSASRSKAATWLRIDAHQAGYKPEQLDLLYRRMFERLQQIPGVKGVAGATYAPMSGDSWNDGVRIQGKPEPHSGDDDGATWTRVTPGFFSTLGNRIVMGRAIDERDTANAPLVAVVNEAFAQKFFKGENPIGKHFGADEMIHAGDYEIVGVAADMRYLNYGFKDPDRPMYFLPAAQHTNYTKPEEIEGEKGAHYLENLVIWAPGKPEGLEMQVRKALSDIDPNPRAARFRQLPRDAEPRLRPAGHDCQADVDLRRARAGARGDRPVRRDRLHGGAAHQRDRHSHGAGSRPRKRSCYGVARARSCRWPSGWPSEFRQRSRRAAPSPISFTR